MVMPISLQAPIRGASASGSEDPESGLQWGCKEMTGSDHGCGMMPEFSERRARKSGKERRALYGKSKSVDIL